MPKWIRASLIAVALTLPGAHASAQDQAMIEAGAQVYEDHCASCHGEQLRSAGAMPDLRDFGPDDRARFNTIVLEGRGQMPAWEGVVSPQEIEQLWAYVRRYAR